MKIHNIIKHDLLCVAYRNEHDLVANNMVKEIFQKIKGGSVQFSVNNVSVNIIC